jgi:Protein of unknown function (DUF2975)
MPLFDRTDFRLTRGALALVAVVAPLVLVGLTVVDWLRGEPLAWSGDTGSTGDLGGLVHAAGGATLTWDGAAEIRVSDASVGLWLAVLAPQLLLAAAVTTVALLLRHVVGEIQAGRPFTASSLRALRVTGVVVLVASVVVPCVSGLTTSAVVERAVDDDALSVSVGFSPLWSLAGFLVLALAEAFRAGARLTEDVEGLV